MIEDCMVGAIQAHYDWLALFYWRLWGVHIHHGYWEDHEPKEVAQLKLIEKLAALAEVEHGARVLDVGCGFGGSSLWLAQKLNCEVTGVTISPVQLFLARQQARRLGLHRQVNFHNMNANRLVFADASFDVIWVIECSEHLDDKMAFISQCSRLLRPGGRLALCAWLKADGLSPQDEMQYIGPVCRGFLCPSLGSMSDYLGWMKASGLHVVASLDITGWVERTWQICIALAGQRHIQVMLKFVGSRMNAFVSAFNDIQTAFAERKMIYGMMAAEKIDPTQRAAT
jgi:tocopherol O-methyltransferase